MLNCRLHPRSVNRSQNLIRWRLANKRLKQFVGTTLFAEFVFVILNCACFLSFSSLIFSHFLYSFCQWRHQFSNKKNVKSWNLISMRNTEIEGTFVFLRHYKNPEKTVLWRFKMSQVSFQDSIISNIRKFYCYRMIIRIFFFMRVVYKNRILFKEGCP